MVMLAICALVLVVSSTLGPSEALDQSEGCILPGNINGRYVGKQAGDVLEEGRTVEVQCGPGTTNRVNGRLRCISPMLDRRLPFCPRDCNLEQGDRLLEGTNFHLSAPLVLPHQYSVTLQCQEGYGSTVPLKFVFCEDGRLTQPRDLAFCAKDVNECNSSPCMRGTCNDLLHAYSCTCPPGYSGAQCQYEPIDDCSEAETSGIYIVKSGLNIKAYCEVDETRRWTVIQRRQDGSVDFRRNWANYSKGFGDVTGEFWLGNDNIHALTAAGWTRLRIDLEDWDNTKHTIYYNTFMVAGEGQNYKLTVSGFRGSNPPGNSLAYANGIAFSTKDQDNDKASGANCAQIRGGTGWWWKSCSNSNLNGIYNGTARRSIHWDAWRGRNYSLKAATMMLSKP